MAGRIFGGSVEFVLLLLIIFQVHATDNSTIELFHKLSSKATFNQYVYNKSLTLKCPFSCKDCPVAGNVRWQINGTNLPFGNNIYASEDLYIDSFDARKHNGLYTCTISIGPLTLRGPIIRVQKKTLPLFTLKPQAVSLNGNAVFSCYDNSQWNNYQFTIRWFKDGEPLVTSSKVVTWDELLFISNVDINDTGEYHCEISSLDGEMKRRSTGKQLSLVKETNQMSTIQYSTKTREVLEGETFTLFCVSQTKTSRVNLYEHNKHHSYLIAEGQGFIRKVLVAGKSSSYTCEAELNKIRAKENIEVHVQSLPKISNPHPIVVSEKIGHVHLKLECNLEETHPNADITWYKDGFQLVGETSKWLEVSKMKVDNSLYQCIATNHVGAVMKLIYVSLQLTGLTPRDLVATTVSPTIFEATWLPPSDYDLNKQHHYIVSWTNPQAKTKHVSVNETQIRIDGEGVYGGAEFLLMVCFEYQPDVEAEDCAYETIMMPEGKPAEGPFLKEIIKVENNIYKVEWNLLPEEVSNGKVLLYTVHCQPFLGTIKGNKKIFVQINPMKSSLNVELDMEGSYSVWVTAHTKIGVSPSSNELVLFTENVGPKDNQLKMTATWSLKNKNNVILSWESLGIENELYHRLNFKIYYVQIPYKEYWKEVYSIESNTTTAAVTNLNRNSIYRFTVVPLTVGNERNVAINRKILGQTSNIYLAPSTNFISKRKRRSTHTILPAPGNLKCVNDFAENQILFVWNPLPEHFNVTGYRINVFNDLQGIIDTYETSENKLLLENLPESFWYGLQVYAYGEVGVVYEKTQFLSCRKQTRVPSKPRDVEYSFVFDKEFDVPFLRLRWKAPEYTGGSVYSYRIVRKSEESSTNPLFPFDWISNDLVMDRIEGEYLHYEGMWTDSTRASALRQLFSISAINDNGIGTPYVNETHPVYFSKSHGNKEESPKNLIEPDNEDIDNRIGILVGVCISFFFMLVFIVICTVKEPCKKITKSRLLGGSSGDSSDDYLYQQKLLETRSSPSESSGESSVLQKNKKLRPWKFFQKLQRHNQQFEDSDYNSSSMRVSYSSGSSGSRTRDCYNKCQPHCTSSCSHVESFSDRTSEGHVTLLPNQPI